MQQNIFYFFPNYCIHLSYQKYVKYMEITDCQLLAPQAN